MSFRLNINLDALNSLIDLQNVNNEISPSTRRLSCGLKIARSADDPAQAAGLAGEQKAGGLFTASKDSLSQIGALILSVQTGALDKAALQSVLGMLNTRETNQTASAASVQDLDIARDAANLAKLRFIQRSSISVLDADLPDPSCL